MERMKSELTGFSRGKGIAGQFEISVLVGNSSSSRCVVIATTFRVEISDHGIDWRIGFYGSRDLDSFALSGDC